MGGRLKVGCSIINFGYRRDWDESDFAGAIEMVRLAD
jgi:hypothetical protein